MKNVDRHSECIELMPGYINETLASDEASLVTAHLQQCNVCRAELQLARALQNYFGRQPSAPGMLQIAEREQRNFERLWTRIETTQFTSVSATKNPTPVKLIPLNFKSLGRQPLASAAALVLLTAISWIFLRDLRSAQKPVIADYRTVSNAAPRLICGQMRAQFIGNIAARDLQLLLRSVDAQIVSGPTEHGVYTLRAVQPDDAVQRLRLHPAVLLVEPTGC